MITNNRLLTNHCTNQTVKEYKYGTDKSDIFVNEKWFIE